MLGLSRSLDAFFDPVMGMLGDRTNTRWGKYRPYLLWICVPLARWRYSRSRRPGTTITLNLNRSSARRCGQASVRYIHCLSFLTNHSQFFRTDTAQHRVQFCSRYILHDGRIG